VRAQDELVYSLLAIEELAPRAAALAASVALLRKGRSVDEAARVSQAAYRGLDAADRARFDELRTLRAQIAAQRLSPVEGARPQDARELAERADRLEAELARRSAAIRGRGDRATLADVAGRVAAALPPGTALVEVVRYRAYAFVVKPGQPRWREPRYAALVLDRDGAIRAADLGPAAGIDEQVKGFLAAVTERDPARRPVADEVLKAAGADLSARVVRPLRPLLSRAKHVVVSPDGQLNLLPFAALPDDGAYLVDRFGLTYVTSGRDLLARAEPARSDEIALFARPEYVRGGAALADAGDADRDLVLVSGPEPTSPAAPLTPGALRLARPPSPLPGTEQEARAIQGLFPRATLALAAEATKDRFLGVQAPRIVHVATHGLFRPASGAAGPGGARDLVLTSEAAPSAAARTDPLVDSMLLWANVTIAAPGAGVVLDPAGLATALEVAGMDLWGTQLVVLSACETGRGAVDDVGQGVYGLRRAVMVAGAQTIVTSLWKVDDAVTRDLMTAYYRRLIEGRGRGEALREASLEIRERHPEPRYWAPFIAIGRVGPVNELGSYAEGRP
jgi:CHAT domain-containing protein